MNVEEHQRHLERYAGFERAVLQDNITLCDQKAGILLAFAAAITVYCLQGLSSATRGVHILFLRIEVAHGFILAVLLEFVAGVLSLATIWPKIVKGSNSTIYWGSSLFSADTDAFIAAINAHTVEQEINDMLRHVHALAHVCRRKFLLLGVSIALTAAGVAAVLIALVINIVGR